MNVEFSVVIPAYNAEAYIRECLDSVLKQDCSHNYEIIVVDDGSTDNTSKVIQNEYPSVRLIKKRNGGPGSARNKGVKNAYSDIIIFIDSDDVMLESRLATQGQFMMSNPHIALSFGNQQYQSVPQKNSNAENNICYDLDFQEIRNAYTQLLIKGNFIANSTCAVRRSIYLSIGGQPEDINVGEDYSMNCSIARSYSISGSCQFFTWYRQGHGDNLMSSFHTYRGPTMVLGKELIEYGRMLDPVEYKASYERWLKLANMLLRWVWISHGHESVRHEIRQLKPLLPIGYSVKWHLISLLPASLGRNIRKLKHNILKHL